MVQGRGVSSVLLKDHSFGCEPGDGSSSDVPLFKIFVELGDKVHVGSLPVASTEFSRKVAAQVRAEPLVI